MLLFLWVVLWELDTFWCVCLCGCVWSDVDLWRPGGQGLEDVDVSLCVDADLG